MSGQERLNNEMSSTDTALGPENTLGGSQAFSVGGLLNSGTGGLSLYFIWVLRNMPALQLSGPRLPRCLCLPGSPDSLDSHAAAPAQIKARKSFVCPQSPSRKKPGAVRVEWARHEASGLVAGLGLRRDGQANDLI